MTVLLVGIPLKFLCALIFAKSHMALLTRAVTIQSPRDLEIVSTVILFLSMIQEGQLSLSGEKLCTILVNHLEDFSCPVRLGKLTTLDMTPLGFDWVVKPQHKTKNKSSR